MGYFFRFSSKITSGCCCFCKFSNFSFIAILRILGMEECILPVPWLYAMPWICDHMVYYTVGDVLQSPTRYYMRYPTVPTSLYNKYTKAASVNIFIAHSIYICLITVMNSNLNSFKARPNFYYFQHRVHLYVASKRKRFVTALRYVAPKRKRFASWRQRVHLSFCSVLVEKYIVYIYLN